MTFPVLSYSKSRLCALLGIFLACLSLHGQTPGGVGANLRAWFKADANVYTTTSPLAVCTNNSVVTQWRDQTANALHLGQTAAAQKPTWLDGSSSAYLNYNPSIKFANNYLYRAAPGILAAAAYNKLNLYVVYYDYDDNDFDWLLYAGGTNGLTRLSVSMNWSGTAVLDCDVPSTYNRVTASTATELPEQRTNILAMKADNGGIYGGGETNKVQYFANGVGGAAKTTHTSITHMSQPTEVGDNELVTTDNTDSPFTGELAELFLYTGSISQAEHQRIESYLALKYAVQINHDLYASTGSTIFSRTGAYVNGIIGIGRDDGSSWSQKQAHQADDSTRVFISTLATTNSGNGGTFSGSGQFVVIGHNGGRMRSATATNSERPSGVLSRIEREWKATNTAFPGTFGLNFKLNTTPITASHLRLLVDDDGNFTNATAYGAADGLTITYSGGVVSITGITTTMVPQNSTRYFTIGSVNTVTPLPVEMLFFTATNGVSAGTVDLRWATATERDNDRFEVERSSDASTFSTIGRVEGFGTAQERHDYAFTDGAPLDGINYYRLKQVDVDGVFEYSTVQAVEVAQRNELVVFPNPAHDVLHVPQLTSAEAIVEVFDALGARSSVAVHGSTLDLSGLPSGIHYLRLNGRIARFVKE